MTTLKDIWPIMTLFYDYNMLFIEKIHDTGHLNILLILPREWEF